MRSVLMSAFACAALVLASSAWAGVSRLPNGKGGSVPQPNNRVPVEEIVDGGFEACVPGNAPDSCADWVEGSTNFGTPVCDFTYCGNGGGTAGPRSGNNWAWFGGSSELDEDGFIEQEVVISANSTSATLDFYLWLGRTSENSGDRFEVSLDGNLLLSSTGAQLFDYSNGYTLVSLDLSAYRDGGSHTIRFFGSFPGSGSVTNLNMDDVSLIVNLREPTTTAITANTPNPSLVGEVVTIAYHVEIGQQPTGDNGHAPSSAVTVNASSGESCGGGLDINGDGNCTITFNTSGNRDLVASFAGDLANAPSTSGAVAQVVNAPAQGIGAEPVPVFGPWALGLLLAGLGLVGGRRLGRKG